MPLPYDWMQIILELRAAGWTYQMIGREMHQSREAVDHIVTTGAEPSSWSRGERLLALYCRVLKRPLPLLGEHKHYTMPRKRKN